jgi:citrate synthase
MKVKISLKDKMEVIVDNWRKTYKEVINNYGDVVIDNIKVRQILGGLRDVSALVCETSFVDPYEGIKFGGYTIKEVLEKLPKPKEANYPYALGIWYLLLTGEIPTEDDVVELEEYIKSKQKLPQYVIEILRNIPANTSPMTQFSIAILAMQRESLFTKELNNLSKSDYWKPMLEDSLNLIARVPVIAAYIYRRTYRDDVFVKPNNDLDWAANFAYMLNPYDDYIINPDFQDLMRLYLILHSDHEGGTVSAHTCFNVSSALSDIYYSVSAGLNGLAGPLHGSASSDSLKWILSIIKFYNRLPTKEELYNCVNSYLDAGKIIPGFGHAVLKVTDPRYLALRDFVEKYKLDSDIFRLIKLLYKVVPEVLSARGKVRDPYPNVDGHSGAMLYHYNIKETEFYPVVFGVSRILGMTAQVIWARAVNYPIERPKSLTINDIVNIAKSKK